MSHNLFQELGDEWAMADTSFFLGRAELETGNLSEAKQSFERSLEVGERVKNLRLIILHIGWNLALMDHLDLPRYESLSMNWGSGDEDSF